MQKQYFFLGGLTRSGGTLLTAILNQNPDIHVSESSPICDLTYKLNQLFNHSIEYNALPFENRRINVLRNLINNYYYDIDSKYIIDKNQCWGTEYNISMIQALYGDNVKIICPVRSVLEILSSYISLIKRNVGDISFIDREILSRGNINIELEDLNDLRCEWLMSNDGTVKKQLSTLENCLRDEFKHMFHLVEYDDLINNPQKEIEKIYEFLEIDLFSHNFDNINYISKSRDSEIYGISDLHIVRGEISKTSQKFDRVLSEGIIEKYKNLEFWRI